MNHPLPAAFLKKLDQLLGTEYPNFISTYDDPASRGLRINTLKLTTHEYMHNTPFTLAPIPWCEEGFYYPTDERPGKHPAHAAGLYYIQEPSAMAVVDVLDPKPGERVLDLAAAPGGKATQIAIQMKNQGLLIANEVHPARAKALSENVERMGITNTIVTNEEVHRLTARYPSYFDRILLDAPCSGEGMFRKDEGARLEWSPESVKLCSTRQIELLEHAAKLLKPRGRLVYSTCTFSPEENEQVIEQFLLKHPDWRLLPIRARNGIANGRPEWGVTHSDEIRKTARLWPHHLNGEGHYIALLEKGDELHNDIPESKSKAKKIDPLLKEAYSYFNRFVDESLTCPWQHIALDRFVLFGSQLYQLPEQSPTLEQLKIVRAGLHLGELKKNRFEPSHALALALRADDFKNSFSLTSTQAELTAFLRGESIAIQSERSGWVGVMMEHFPIGWGKASQGVLKNHYPKGLRLLY